MTTGEGKPAPGEARTSVYKRAADQSYQLKRKFSRQVLGQVNKRFPTYPFSIRALEDLEESQARSGILECVTNKLLDSYPVLYEKAGAHVAHFKFTVLVLPSGPEKITGLPLNEAGIKTDKTPPEELKALLAASASKKKKKKSKKKAAAAGGAGGEEE